MVKKYQIIYADPPWKLQSMSSTAWKTGRSPLESKYPLMNLEEIKNLPVEQLADKKCSLFLWVTHSMLQNGLDVMKAWGFKYHVTITWDKGQGFSLCGFNRNTELCLYGYKGGINLNQKGKYIPTIISEKRRKHSQKPLKMFELIESNAPSPRIELFARQKRDGWDVWGNEVESDIIL